MEEKWRYSPYLTPTPFPFRRNFQFNVESLIYTFSQCFCAVTNTIADRLSFYLHLEQFFGIPFDKSEEKLALIFCWACPSI